jgi:hypothetical protein
MKKLISILLFFHFNYSDVSANHLIGGELSYRKLGGTNYEITLKVFRDYFLNANKIYFILISN